VYVCVCFVYERVYKNSLYLVSLKTANQRDVTTKETIVTIAQKI